MKNTKKSFPFGGVCFCVAAAIWLILGIADQSVLKCLAALCFFVGGIAELRERLK